MHDPITLAGPLSARDRALLRELPLFQALSAETLNALLATSVRRACRRGADLIVQGEAADRFFVVLDGWIKLYRVNRDGAEAVVRVLGAGESFGEAAMFARSTFPVNAQAASDAHVLSISVQAVERTIRADVDVAFAMLASLSMRLRDFVHRIESLQVQSAPQRVGAFLLEFCPPGKGSATFALPFEKGLAAQKLGMKPETFSRSLATLRAIGVENEGAVVSVEDLDALRSFCVAEDADLDI